MGSPYPTCAGAPSSLPLFHISPVKRIGAPGSGAATGYLDYRDFCVRIDALPKNARLHLGGHADPLLHLHFFQMVRYAAARGMHVSTATFLTVFPEYLAQECVTSGLHGIHVLLNAANAGTYRETHGKDCFHKVMRNIQRLMQAKAAARAVQPHLYLSCTALPANISQLPQLVQLACETNVDGMQVTLAEEQALWQEDRQRVGFHFKRARATAERLNVALELPDLHDGNAKLSGAWNKSRPFLPYPQWAG